MTKKIFLSSSRYKGALGGLAGADARCQGLAAAASLTGTFKAWLSDDTTSASARLTHAGIPYVLVDGTLVASDFAALAGNGLAHAIDQTEKGQPPTLTAAACGTFAAVWTGTTANGASAVGSTCSGWVTSPATNQAMVGDAQQKSSWWTDECSGPYQDVCGGNTAALYCLEQ